MRTRPNAIICRYQDPSRVRVIEPMYLDAALLYRSPVALLYFLIKFVQTIFFAYISVLFISLLNNITSNSYL